MKKTIIILALVLSAILCACSAPTNAYTETAVNTISADTIPAPARSTYDTSALLDWCGASEVNTVRMVGAVVGKSADNYYILEDEHGELWCVEDVDIDDNDFLLLWIDDAGTPDDTNDDVVIKVWREVH